MLAVNIAVVSLVFVPYLLFIIIGQKEARKLSSKFKEEVKKNNLQINERENWNQNILGLDVSKQKLLFVQKRNEEFCIELIDLNSVKLSRLAVESKEIVVNEKKENLLQTITLEFLGYNLQEKQEVCLYDFELNFSQDFEMRRAEKWNKLINSCLSLKPVFQKVA